MDPTALKAALLALVASTAGLEACGRTVYLYGAQGGDDTADTDDTALPTEVCDNAQDDDGDEAVDCDDPDCADDPACQIGGAYAAPF